MAAPLPDVLGAPFTCQTIELASDFQGEVVATLVHAAAPGGAVRGAVLHVHGYNDYFFQTWLATWWNRRGYDFYALDLRKYGRSLRAHQTPYFVTDLSQYAPELDEAYRLITERDGHRHLVVHGHSTGGLVVALWAAHRQRLFPALRGVLLNAPWFHMDGPALLRSRPAETLARLVRRVLPHRAFGRRSDGLSLYGSSLHRDHRGEYSYDTDWKTLRPHPLRAGWVAAVVLAQAEVRRGLDLRLPVLCLTSDRSSSPTGPTDPDIDRTDVVLDVERNVALARTLGPEVEVVRVAGARHDVFCSRQPVQDEAWRAVADWLSRRVEFTA